MSRVLPIEKNLIISVPDNYTNTKRGSFFEQLCADILRWQSYAITGIEVRKTGMEVDIQATHEPSSRNIYVECKFYNDRKTIDTGILDLCYAQAQRGRFKSIALFSTVKLGKDAQGAYEDYLDMEVDYSFYGSEDILKALEACGKVKGFDDLDLPSKVTSASLLIHPELPICWLFQEVEDGTPSKLIAYSLGEEIDIKQLKRVLKAEGKFEGLNLTLYKSHDVTPSSTPRHVREVVSNIVVADDIMDYKPCRPEDFVGRDSIQKEIWDFLETVRTGKSDCRLMSLTGSSGNGKSSLVAYLANRFKNVKWKNKLFLYPVDVRSARGARFVSEAITKAFDAAIKSNFIELNTTFQIDNIEDITGAKAFLECDQYLKKSEKVVIVFFDQFEEVFMKEELFALFNSFKRFGLDVSSEKCNLVVGFSWRNGIFLGDDNPAYGLWNDLRDHRVDKKLSLFDEGDASKMIQTFEKRLGISLNKALKGRLIQQAQGLPWLLKKLCIHLFKKIKEGVSQEELLITQMQIKTLFDEDLERPDKQNECLRFVAHNSPVDRYEVAREFGEETVGRLLSDRLLVRTGEKVSVYWDVFRDYLISEETPLISWGYMPASMIGMATKTLTCIPEDSTISFNELLSATKYKKGTLTNILMDLQSFSLITKANGNDIKALQSHREVPEKVRSHMLGHVVFNQLIELQKESGKELLADSDLQNELNKTYSNKQDEAPRGYLTRISAWLRYAGLLSKVGNKIRIYKDDYSPDFGVVVSRGKGGLFLGASTCDNVIELINRIKNDNTIDFESKGVRNSTTDLVNLGICYKNSDGNLKFTQEKYVTETPEKILSDQVEKATSIVVLNSLVEECGEDLDVLSQRLASELGKTWKESSRSRYIRSLMKYRAFSMGFESI
ncbi:TPA: restriction endonuclease [Vibrio diabolicus]